MEEELKELRVSLPTNAISLGEVAPEYISTTLDWWSPSNPNWGDGASVLRANLTHPKLLRAARGLAPFFLRIGGSRADSVWYDFPAVGEREDGENEDDDEDEDGGKPPPGWCARQPDKCLNSQRWEEVLNFCDRAGCRIVFTLAYLVHTTPKPTANEGQGPYDFHDWNSANARRFLVYNAARIRSRQNKPDLLYGLELGNELQHAGKATNITRMVKAYEELNDMVKELWNDGWRRPKIAGPASTGKKGLDNLLSHLGPHLDIATYHKYHGTGRDEALLSKATRPDFYAHPAWFRDASVAVRKYMLTDPDRRRHQQQPPELWIGEGALAYNSGRAGVTDTFASSLWFANLLGALAKTYPIPHRVYCRQTLLGGNYGLISRGSYEPLPDYWIAYIWKRLVGTVALGPIVSDWRKDEHPHYLTFGCCKSPRKDALLFHAFCAQETLGDAVFVVINTSGSSSYRLKFALGSSRTEYIVRPVANSSGAREDGDNAPYNQLSSAREVRVNGNRLTIASEANGSLSMLEGVKRQREDPTIIYPYSISFVVAHDTNLGACKGGKAKEVSGKYRTSGGDLLPFALEGAAAPIVCLGILLLCALKMRRRK